MKHVLTVFGVVHPHGGAWYLDEPFTTTTLDGSKIQITLADSAYSMRVETEGPDNIDASMADGSLATWINEVIYGHQPLLRGLLDSLGLHLGAALDPEMTGGILDGVVIIGNLTKLGAYGTQDGTSRVGGESFFPTWLLTVSNPFARLALADVRHALRFDEDCPFFCYRAVDSLRQHYAAATEATSEKASWEKLRTELGIERAEIMALKASADTRRHGGAGASVHADHLRWTRWTREVVGRFLTKHSADLQQTTSGRRSDGRIVQTVMITGAFLAESAETVNNKLNVTGGVLEHVTIDPTQKPAVTLILVLLTQTQRGEPTGNVEIKVRPPIHDADPLVITEPLPEEAARGEMGFAYFAIRTNIWHHFEGRWVVEASAGGNTASLPLNVHHTN